MKIIKCDLCGKETTKYTQVKYRHVDNESHSDPTHLEICNDCFRHYIEDISKVSKKCHIADMVKKDDMS